MMGIGYNNLFSNPDIRNKVEKSLSNIQLTELLAASRHWYRHS